MIRRVMKVMYLDNSTDKLMGLSGTQIKVLLAMVKVCKNNIVDLQRTSSRLGKMLEGMNERSISNAISKLSREGILVKTGVPRVWFIDPSYFMKGYYKRVYSISEMIENKDRYLLERVKEWEDEDDRLDKELVLVYRWDNKRIAQRDIGVQVKIVEDNELKEKVNV